MKYVCAITSVLLWVTPFPHAFAADNPPPTPAATKSEAVTCDCPKLACEPCSVERGTTFYSEKCGPKNSKVKSCGRPTCIPILEPTAACPIPPERGSKPTEPVVVAPPKSGEPTAAKAVGAKVGQVRVIQGTVAIVNDEGQRTQVTADSEIHETDTIESGPDGKAVVEFQGGNKVHLHPETSLQVKEFKEPGSEDSRKALLSLIRGKIRNQVKQKYNGKTSYYRVQTKAAVAGVRGTDFVMEYKTDGRLESKVETLEGRVVLSNLDETKTREILRGEGASVIAQTDGGGESILSEVYKMSPEALQKLEEESSVDLAKAAVPKPKKSKSREAFICEIPKGRFNDCKWELTDGACLRSRCNANGAWAESTPVSGDLCTPKGPQVKVCDY